MGAHIYFKYPPNYTFGGKKVLNIGCGFGQFKAENVTNLDGQDICDPDVVWDLEKTPLPFKDETFDLIVANHIMEHIHNWWEVFNDCARILKTNGVIEIWVPGQGADSMLGYRDHVSFISAESFSGCFGAWRAGGNAWAEVHNQGRANWMKPLDYKTRTIDKWWIKYAPTALKSFMVNHLRNCSVEQGFFFRKITVAEYEAARRSEEGRKEDVRAGRDCSIIK